MNSLLDRYFRLTTLGTTIRKELLGGITTFVTMAYIIIVNPKILEAAGMPFGASMVATIVSASFGTLLMGLYARRPFAVAPYMGENAFIAYTVVKVMGYSWETALGAIFISGILFTILTILHIRSWLATAIPESLKIAFAVGVGLFLAFIGLNDTGIVVIGIPGAPVRIGNFHEPSVLLAIGGFILMGMLMLKRIPGAMMLGILTVTAISFVAGLTPVPPEWISAPPSLRPLAFKLDITASLTWGMFSVILTVFVLAFLDTLGTLIALGYKAEILDSDGNLPDIEKPMLADAVATTVASVIGTTTTGAYIESATGIAEGAKSGLASVVTALLFLLALFLAPTFTAIPPHAYGPALIIVGVLMLKPITRIQFNDLSEAIPAFCVVALMSFTYNIGIGMTAGFVVYPLFKIAAGKLKEIRPGMWVLGLLSALFYIFYPY